MPAVATTSWDLSGRLVVRVEGVDVAQRDAIENELDPFRPTDTTRAADVAVGCLPPVDILELQGPSNDQRTTAVDRTGHLLARFGNRWMEVPPPSAWPVQVNVEPGLAIGLCWGEVFRPALHQALRTGGAVAVHGAAVDGGPTGGTLVSGWSESGKTEVALALLEAGASFLSDKWTVAGTNGEISAFPVGVGVRGWVMPALPQLQASLPRRARTQLATTRLVRATANPLVERGGGGRVTRLAFSMFQRAVDLGDRAHLSPTALRQVYGQADDPARTVNLDTVLLLLTSPSDEVVVEEVTSKWTARRLALTAAYERRRYFDLQERGVYAGLPDRGDARDRAVAEEERLLSTVLGRASQVLRVTCPFPGDPRRVVDALAARR